MPGIDREDICGIPEKPLLKPGGLYPRYETDWWPWYIQKFNSKRHIQVQQVSAKNIVATISA